MATYPSSLTDTEWVLLEPLLPKRTETMRGRPVENTHRDIIDGILYILRTDGAWRMMPNDLPHWKTCYHYFRLWSKLGDWKRIHDAIRDQARAAVGKKAPTAAILDSQSVRTASQPGLRGFDAGKKITGRKRHVLIDTLGFILGLEVTPADIQDRDGARSLLRSILSTGFGWIKLIWADGGYSGQLVEEVSSIPRHRNVKLQIVKRSDDTKGFNVLPKRWIVERTFGCVPMLMSLP